MQVTTYRELKSKDDFMILMDQAFGWPPSQNEMNKLINLDIRLKNSPVGFCSVEDGKLTGFVGVLDIPTRIFSGKEVMVGGIWCVATNPNFVKRGICKTLMERAHQYFQEKNYPFSFLQTSRDLTAYAIYLKMGYVDVKKVNSFLSAYRILKKDKIKKKTEVNLNPEKIFEIYKEFTKSRTGFVLRQKDFVDFFIERKYFDKKLSFQEKNGYALVSEVRDVVKIRELVSLNAQTYQKLLDQIESITPYCALDRRVNDETLLKIYKERGYRKEKGRYGVLMVKQLGDIGFEETYGDNFYIGELDMF